MIAFTSAKMNRRYPDHAFNNFMPKLCLCFRPLGIQKMPCKTGPATDVPPQDILARLGGGPSNCTPIL